jgi:hypothetical protein
LSSVAISGQRSAEPYSWPADRLIAGRWLLVAYFTAMSTAETPGASTPDPHELKMAFKAFKKRLKLTRLDAESKLNRSPLSSGKSSGIIAIEPPNQYPQAVWDALVKEGKLKYAGHGTYQLTDE